MAFTIRIIGVPVMDEHSIWVVDHVMWWPVDELIGKMGQESAEHRFRQSVDSTLYLDYVGIFNKDEFTRLDEDYRAEFLANADKKSWHQVQQQLMEIVDEYLRQRPDIKWILVEKYEWESGMN